MILWDGTPLELSEELTFPDQVRFYRNINCSKVSQCLDHAIARKWKGFSCRECSFFLVEPKSTVSIEGAVRAIDLRKGAYSLPFLIQDGEADSFP